MLFHRFGEFLRKAYQMIKIQVKNEIPIIRNWVDKSTGEQRSMRIQTLLIYLPDSQGKMEDYDKVDYILADKSNAFTVGFYTLVPQCLYLDRNGRLQVSFGNMQLIQQKLASAA